MSRLKDVCDCNKMNILTVNENSEYIYDFRYMESDKINLNMCSDVKKPVIIKTSGLCKPSDVYKLILVDQDVYFYSKYENANIMPYLYDGKIMMMQAIIRINKKYILGIKEKNQKNFNLVCGQLQKYETMDECIIREISDKINIRAKDISSIKKLMSYPSMKTQYQHQFRAIDTIFVIDITVKAERYRKIQSKKKSQSHQILFISIENFLQTQPHVWSPLSRSLIQKAFSYEFTYHIPKMNGFDKVELANFDRLYAVIIVNKEHIMGIRYKVNKCTQILNATRKPDETFEMIIKRVLLEQLSMSCRNISDLTFISLNNNILTIRIDLILKKTHMMVLRRRKTSEISSTVITSPAAFFKINTNETKNWCPTSVNYVWSAFEDKIFIL